jgi:hypothetical protein
MQLRIIFQVIFTSKFAKKYFHPNNFYFDIMVKKMFPWIV